MKGRLITMISNMTLMAKLNTYTLEYLSLKDAIIYNSDLRENYRQYYDYVVLLCSLLHIDMDTYLKQFQKERKKAIADNCEAWLAVPF